MLQVLQEVDPARVGLHAHIANIVVDGGAVEFTPGRVQGGHPGIAAACQVQYGEVERQSYQVVAQRLRHEFIDLVTDRTSHTAHDGTRRLFGCGAACRIGQRIEEGCDQADLLAADILCRV